MDHNSARYTSLRATLFQIKEDLSAVLSILSVEADGGEGFLGAAFAELRAHWVAGQLQQADEISALLGAVLEAREMSGQGETELDAASFRGAARGLAEGIRNALQADGSAAAPKLSEVANQAALHPSIRWTAQTWLSRVHATQHDIESAGEAATGALELAEKLDGAASAVSLCEMADIERQRGEYDSALSHLTRAATIYEGFDDPHGVAKTKMAAAKIERARGQFEAASAAAQQARDLDVKWHEPVLFLAAQSIINRRIADARQVLDGAGASFVEHPDYRRISRFLEMSENHKVKEENLISFLKICETPPSPDFVMQLEVIVEHEPGFFDAHELLAWTLYRLENLERAKGCFEELIKQDLPAELRESALLGMGCVANRMSATRQPGGWVRKTTQMVEDEGGESIVTSITEISAGEPPVARSSTGKQSASSGDGPEVETAAALTGPLQLFAVPDLLDFLKSSRRTGTLVVTSEHGMGAVHMVDGMVAGAASPNAVALGELLTQQGEATEEDIARVAEQKDERDPHRLFGAALVQQGVVSADAVKGALTTQIKSAVRELVGWTSGQFAFEPEQQRTEDDPRISVYLDTQSLVLDALRELDEEGRD